MPDVLLDASGAISKDHAWKEAGVKVMDVEEGTPCYLLFHWLLWAKETDYHEFYNILKSITAFGDHLQVIDAYSDPLPRLSEILEHAIFVFHADDGYLFLREGASTKFVCEVARGAGAGRLYGRRVETSGSFLEEVVEKGKRLNLRLMPEEISSIEFFREAEILNLMAAPILLGGVTMGIMLLGRRKGDEFPGDYLDLLATEAILAGLTLQISRAYQDMEASSIRDKLSDLFNEHYFRQRLVDEVGRARRYSLNLCLLVIEVDGLQEYYERNGRMMGDLVLSDIGNIVLKNTREVDIPARYGDNRFYLLLPETRRLGAVRLAERLRKVIEEYPFPSREKKEAEKLTVCIGISCFPATADSEDSLINNALLALQAAQEMGTNQIRLYSEELRESG
jgi:diguanylate cyclase (GGDEF)-like protein